jgi:elongation factor Ts
MSKISIEAVKSLRDRTGAGMMDCKRALQESGGDEEAAIDLLRQRGAAKAAKRAEREVQEGVVQIAESPDGDAVAMVEVACETDFVARNDEFVAFARRAAGAVAGAGELADGEVHPGETVAGLEGGALEEELNELRAAIGENLQLGRGVRYERSDDSAIGQYVHFGNRIGVLVEIGGADDDPDAAGEVATEVAMHVAAADPLGVSPEDIPEEVRERERSVLQEQARQEDKPPEIVEKIVEGRMRKFYAENALTEQPFVKDPDRTVGELVEERVPGGGVRRFVRFEVGS